MIITDFLEKNARLYGQETALVEINPSEERDKAVTWWDFNLIESAGQDAPYRRELSWKDFDMVPRNPTGKIEKPVLRQRYCSDRLVEAQIKG